MAETKIPIKQELQEAFWTEEDKFPPKKQTKVVKPRKETKKDFIEVEVLKSYCGYKKGRRTIVSPKNPDLPYMVRKGYWKVISK